MPEWKPEIRLRLAQLSLAPTREAAIVEELAQDLDDCYAALLASGLSEAQAYQQTLAELRGSEFLRRELQRVERHYEPEPIPLGTNRRTNMIADLWQDVRFGLRVLRKQPGFTLIAVLTLSLGIGANTAMFSVVNALLLRPLPYPNPEQLLWVEEATSGRKNQPAWGAHFLAWQARSQTLAGIAQVNGATRTLTGVGEPERIAVGEVSASFLPLLGAQPLAGGRNFTAAEDAPGGERVALLSHALWQRRFSGAPDRVGKTITLNEANYTVIGVLPASFRFSSEFDVWVPLALNAQAELVGPNQSFQTTIARLKPGVSLEQARAEMDTLSQQYEATRAEQKLRLESRTQLTRWQDHLLGNLQRPLLILLGAVALILLIACANVANLLLARAVTRQKELAIRAAIGASRARLLRQMLAESLLLALSGGAAGLLLAAWLTQLLSALLSTDTIGELARVTTITIDWRVLGFTLLVSLLTGLLCGLLPTLQLARPDLTNALREGGRSSFHSRGLRSALMVSEIALAMMLLIGAGLLIRSFVQLLNVDPGYRAENLLTARLALPSRYSEKAQRVQFYDRILQRVSAIPGVVAVGATSHLPLTNYNMGSFLRVEGRLYPAGEQPPGAPVSAVNPDYFRTMNIELRTGRFLTDGDADGAPSVALLSESLAQQLFPNENAVGKRLAIGGSGAEWTTIIGVVSNVRHQGREREVEPAVYLSYRQLPRPGMTLLLRSTTDSLSLAPALRQAVHEVDSALPLYDVKTMEERLTKSVAARRFNLLLLSVFAALALGLAGIGVYGVISYVVTERTHEIGIRLALGAQRADVLRLFLQQGMKLVLLGVSIGLLGTVAFTRVMTSLLFGVSAYDPLTFAGVTCLLSLLALLACYLPARRATKVDPLVALRSE